MLYKLKPPLMVQNVMARLSLCQPDKVTAQQINLH